MLKDLLQNLPEDERATRKGLEISKIGSIVRTNVKFSGVDYDIEIVEMNPIEEGVEVLARAWNPGGSQIGFGKDGTVDIERFLFYNPGIMTPDGTKRTIHQELPRGGTVDYEMDNLKEDLEQAILDQLAETIRVKKQKFDGSKIIPNNVGSTTSTFNSVSGANSPVDGQVQNNAVGSWATIHDGSTGTAGTGPSGVDDFQAHFNNASERDIRRAIVHFDTAAIDDGDTITDATFSIFIKTFTETTSWTGTNVYLRLVTSNPASDSDIVTTDFDFNDFGTTAIGVDLAKASISTSAFNDWVINTPDTNVSKTGLTKWGVRTGDDVADIEYPNPTNFTIAASWADDSSNPPKLVVEHAVPAGTVVKDVIGLGIIPFSR